MHARKRPLPFLPRRIGVVTSASGAVIRDIVRVAHRRFPIPILLAPDARAGRRRRAGDRGGDTPAGQRSPTSTCIIVARGGGSLEDLWAFNEEALARAIAACRVPVISAVGHETDFTIADFVADLRAPTPSAAAEMAVPVRGRLRGRSSAVLRRRGWRARCGASRGTPRYELERARARLGDPRRLLDERRQRLDELVDAGGAVLARRLARRAPELSASERGCTAPTPSAASPSSAAPWRRCATGWMAAAATRAGAPAPRARGGVRASWRRCRRCAVLERGYSLTRRADGHVITSAADAAPGRDASRSRVHDGGVDATGSKPATLRRKETK